MSFKKRKQVKKDIAIAKRQTKVVRGTKYGSLWGGVHTGFHKGSALQRYSLKKHSKIQKKWLKKE